jgi:hypothetical protein
MRYHILIASFGLALSSLMMNCSGKEKKSEPAAAQEKKNNLPALPQNEYSLLVEQCDFIDYIFIDLPFSLSQNEKESIQQNILFIDRAGLDNIPQGCKPIARKFFKIKGNIVLEADVFMDNTCQHFIFYKDNKAVYANKMAQSGINFYNNLIEQAAKIGQ